MHLDTEKNPSRVINQQNKNTKIARSRQLLPQQNTLPQNTEELKSKKEKTFFYEEERSLLFFHKLVFFLLVSLANSRSKFSHHY